MEDVKKYPKNLVKIIDKALKFARKEGIEVRIDADFDSGSVKTTAMGYRKESSEPSDKQEVSSS